MVGLRQRILQFVKDIDIKKKKWKEKWLPENISEALLGHVGLAVFSFWVLMLYGHWRHLCTVDSITATEEREKEVCSRACGWHQASALKNGKHVTANSWMQKYFSLIWMDKIFFTAGHSQKSTTSKRAGLTSQTSAGSRMEQNEWTVRTFPAYMLLPSEKLKVQWLVQITDKLLIMEA